MDTADSNRSQAEASPPTPEALQRSRRFVEVIDYALQVFGAEAGTSLGAQRRLSEAVGVSTTMLTRYKQGVDFDNLKCATIRQLAKVMGIDPGAIFAWIEEGREAAMEHQRLLAAKPVAFSPFDLMKELEISLRRAIPVEAIEQPHLRADELAAAVDSWRQDSPVLFDRFVAALGLAALLEELPSRAGLEPQEWEQLAELTGTTADALRQRFFH